MTHAGQVCEMEPVDGLMPANLWVKLLAPKLNPPPESTPRSLMKYLDNIWDENWL